MRGLRRGCTGSRLHSHFFPLLSLFSFLYLILYMFYSCVLFFIHFSSLISSDAAAQLRSQVNLCIVCKNYSVCTSMRMRYIESEMWSAFFSLYFPTVDLSAIRNKLWPVMHGYAHPCTLAILVGELLVPLSFSLSLSSLMK